MARPEGIIVSSITPFTKAGNQVYTTWFPEHVSYLRQAGVNGLAVMGSMSEGAAMTPAEMKQMVDLALLFREELSVVVGTGSAPAEEAIALGSHAVDKGADAIQVVPPHTFEDRGPKSRLDFLAAVLHGLPGDSQVLLYHDPRQTGGDLTDSVIDALLDRFPERVFGIKDASDDAEHMRGLIARYPQLRIYAGRDAMMVADLRSGVAGAFSAMANVVPAAIADVQETHRQGGNLAEMEWLMTPMQEVLISRDAMGAIKGLIPLLAAPGMTYPHRARLTRSLACGA